MVTWNKAARPRKGDALTRRDLDIHALLAAGNPTPVIADHRFGVTPGTVKAHLASVYTKIGAQTAVEAARHHVDHHTAPPPGGGWWPDKPRQRRADHSRPASTRP